MIIAPDSVLPCGHTACCCEVRRMTGERVDHVVEVDTELGRLKFWDVDQANNYIPTPDGPSFYYRYNHWVLTCTQCKWKLEIPKP